MSGFSSKRIEVGKNEESAVEKEKTSPRAGSSVSKRCPEASLEEQPRKIRAGALTRPIELDAAGEGVRSTPLHDAAFAGRVEEIRVLLSAGARTRARDEKGMTPLHRALKWHKEGAAEILSEADAGNDLPDEKGRTPLHHAALRGFIGVLRKLLSAGADTRSQDKDQMTPLHLALVWRREAAAEVLSDVDAGNDQRNKDGHTPLHCAAMQGYAGVVGKLLCAGACTRSQDQKQKTPLHLALYRRKQSAAKVILRADAENSVQDNYGHTPLHLAVSQGCLPVARKLLYSGVLPHSRDNRGKSALEIAEDRREGDILWLMLSMCVLQGIVIDCEKKGPGRVRLVAEIEEDIRRMKETKVGVIGVSYHDVATRCLGRVASWLANDSVRKELLEGRAAQSFPHYTRLIAYRVKMALRKKDLKDQCLPILSEELPQLPEITIEHIISYLTDRDMRNLILAFKTRAQLSYGSD